MQQEIIIELNPESMIIFALNYENISKIMKILHKLSLNFNKGLS